MWVKVLKIVACYGLLWPILSGPAFLRPQDDVLADLFFGWTLAIYSLFTGFSGLLFVATGIVYGLPFIAVHLTTAIAIRRIMVRRGLIRRIDDQMFCRLSCLSAVAAFWLEWSLLRQWGYPPTAGLALFIAALATGYAVGRTLPA